MSWWRANRLWLPALPVALALMLVASAYDAWTYWYSAGPHHELGSAAAGEYVAASDPFTDAVGETSRTFRVRLGEIEPAEEFPYDDVEGPRPPPDGLEAIVVHLDWVADPDQALRGCQIVLVDDAGRRYGLLADVGQTSQCVPEDAGGPEAPFDEDQGRGSLPYGEPPRPARWSTAPVFLVPQDRAFTQVQVWWDLPDYVTLSVP